MHDVFRKLGVEKPIFQAPIGSVATPDLAVAVAEAGGIGHLACTWRKSDQLKVLFRQMKARTSRPWGANFVLSFPIEELLAVALDEGVSIVSLFWGDGSTHLAKIKAAGAIAIQAVGSVAEAKRAADAGFDLIVAQGHEAGGHVRGMLGTMALVPQVVDAVSPIPVIAAGGIADRRGVAAALALGAAGVWVGTRFLAAKEAGTHPAYRELLLAASGDDTVYSELFNLGWTDAPVRTLRNSTVHAWENAGRPLPPHRPDEGREIARRADGAAIPRYHFAAPTREMSGEIEAMALYAGEAVGLVRSGDSAAAIVNELAGGWA